MRNTNSREAEEAFASIGLPPDENGFILGNFSKSIHESFEKPFPTEVRQGKTGRWAFVMKTPDCKILATAEWGTNHEFAEKEWNDLPVIP